MKKQRENLLSKEWCPASNFKAIVFIYNAGSESGVSHVFLDLAVVSRGGNCDNLYGPLSPLLLVNCGSSADVSNPDVCLIPCGQEITDSL